MQIAMVPEENEKSLSFGKPFAKFSSIICSIK
jgi:hypothetical protein